VFPDGAIRYDFYIKQHLWFQRLYEILAKFFFASGRPLWQVKHEVDPLRFREPTDYFFHSHHMSTK